MANETARSGFGKSNFFLATRWQCHGDRVGCLGHCMALNRHGSVFPAGQQPFFFEIRFFHQPMCKPPQKLCLRPTSVKPPGPEPGMVRQQLGNTPAPHAVEHHKGAVVRAVHDGASRRCGGFDQAKPSTPIGRGGFTAGQSGGDRVASALIGHICPKTLFNDFSRWLCGKDAS